MLLLGAVLAVAGVVAIERLNEDRLYRGLLAEGDTAMANGAAYLAVEAFSGALAVRSDSMVAHYRRGEAYATLGQVSQAERDLRQALRLAPDAPEPLEALGRLHDRRGDYATAADWYTQAADRLHDTDARLLYALALARYRTGALPAARDAARRALARDDTLAEAHYLLGLVATDLRSPREATTAFEQAVRLRPSFAAAFQELAAVDREQGRPADEIRQLQTLVRLDPRVDRQIALAQAHLRAGDHSRALDALAAAETTTPGDSRVALATGRVHLTRAEATADSESITAALTALERALSGTARRSEGLALYGRALYLSGDAARAEQLLEEATHTSPIDRAAFGYLADAAEQLGHHAVARNALLSLDALAGNTATVTERRTRARRIGALALADGDAEGAVTFLNRALSHGDATATTRGLLARALWAADRHDDARLMLESALAQAPGDLDLMRIARTFR